MAEDNAIENELATPEGSPEHRETERKARNVGWVPKEEFRGDPARHVSAEEFLARSDSLMPLLRRDNDKLHRKVSDLENVLKETRDAQREYLEYTSKAEERAYQRAKAELEARAVAAAGNADQAGVQQAMRDIQALEKPYVIPPRSEPVKNVDPTIQDWIARERWFTSSEALKGYATETFGEIEREAPGMTVDEMLAETKRRTMDRFPEKFGINPRRDAPAAVSTPSGRTAQRRADNGRSYDNLPADAKQACEKFLKTIPGFTKEQYVASYDWDA